MAIVERIIQPGRGTPLNNLPAWKKGDKKKKWDQKRGATIKRNRKLRNGSSKGKQDFKSGGKEKKMRRKRSKASSSKRELHHKEKGGRTAKWFKRQGELPRNVRRNGQKLPQKGLV